METATLRNFKVLLLGVIFDPKEKKILIGKRKKDPYTPKSSWVFPGGDANYEEDIDKTLKKHVKKQTGFDIKNHGSIFVKTYPQKGNLLAIYFFCEINKGNMKEGDLLTELKWVKSNEIEEYFGCAFHTRLKEYIDSIK